MPTEIIANADDANCRNGQRPPVVYTKQGHEEGACSGSEEQSSRGAGVRDLSLFLCPSISFPSVPQSFSFLSLSFIPSFSLLHYPSASLSSSFPPHLLLLPLSPYIDAKGKKMRRRDARQSARRRPATRLRLWRTQQSHNPWRSTPFSRALAVDRVAATVMEGKIHSNCSKASIADAKS